MYAWVKCDSSVGGVMFALGCWYNPLYDSVHRVKFILVLTYDTNLLAFQFDKSCYLRHSVAKQSISVAMFHNLVTFDLGNNLTLW